MLFPEITKLKSLNLSKSNIDRLNSAKYPKKNKTNLKLTDKHSSIIPHFQNINNNSYENRIKRIPNNTSVYISEKEENNINKNIFKPIKFNNPSEKTQTEKDFIPNIFECNFRRGHKLNVFTHREIYSMNKRKFWNKPIDVDKFIKEVNSFLLPNNKTFGILKNMINYRIKNKESLKNTIFGQIFKRNDFPVGKFTYEIFYKYIIKNTFKEVLKKSFLNNSMANKKEIKEEYLRQLNGIKEYLNLHNNEFNDINDNNNIESFVLNNNNNNNKNISNNNSNNLSMNNSIKEKNLFKNKRYKKLNIEKHKRNRKIIQNNSSDNIFSQHYNYNKSSLFFNTKNLNMNSKNQELIKKDSIRSFDAVNNSNNNTKFTEEKNQIQSKASMEKDVSPNKETKIKLKEIIQKQKKAFSNQKLLLQKINNNNNKGDMQIKSENSIHEKIKGFNLFFNKKNENVNKNEDIIGFLNNKDKKVIFSNRFINDKINRNFFRTNIIKLDFYKNNENINQKKVQEITRLHANSFENKDFYNKSSNFENENKSLYQTKFNNSFLKSSSQKYLIDKGLNKEKEKEGNKNPSKIMKDNFTQLNYKDFNPIKEENEKNFTKILFNNKLAFKKKKAVRERSFKDFLREESYEENVKTLNNKIEDKKAFDGNLTNKMFKIKKIKIGDDERLMEESWEFKFNNFKNYIQKLKNMSKDEFIKDTLKFIKYSE